MSRREEWLEQVKFAGLLERWLDEGYAFATATDPVASSKRSGAMRRRRGVKPGVPDSLVLYRGRLITIEMKPPDGRCSPSQRAVREALLRAGCCDWRECRSANGAMSALARSGVKFRTLIHEDGTRERWRQPRLAAWEVPRRDPAERRPWHPQVAEQRRESRRRSLKLKRAREAAQVAMERGDLWREPRQQSGPEVTAMAAPARRVADRA